LLKKLVEQDISAACAVNRISTVEKANNQFMIKLQAKKQQLLS